MSTAIEQIIADIEQLSVIDLVQLQNEMAQRWGPAIVPWGGQAKQGASVFDPFATLQPGDSWSAPYQQPEEQTEFGLVLIDYGDHKINVIKVVRELTSLGLKEAKELVESAPVTIREGMTRDELEVARLKLVGVGAMVGVS